MNIRFAVTPILWKPPLTENSNREARLLKLHFAPNSRAQRSLWLLEELGLPYELNKMAFHPKDLKSDDHRARHPLGRVPVLEDGDISIFESGAIAEYILERHKNGGLKPAVDAPEFPAYLQWFHYCEGMVMPPVNTIVVHTLLLPPERQDATVRDQAKRGSLRVPLSPSKKRWRARNT